MTKEGRFSKVSYHEKSLLTDFRKLGLDPIITPIMPHFTQYSLISLDNQNCNFVFEIMDILIWTSLIASFIASLEEEVTSTTAYR